MSRGPGRLLARPDPRPRFGPDQHDPLVLRLAVAVARRRGRHRPAFPRARGAQAGTLLFELSNDVLRDRLAKRDETALALATRLGLDRLRGRSFSGCWPLGRRSTGRRGPTRRRSGLSSDGGEFWRRDTVPRLLRLHRRVGRRANAVSTSQCAIRPSHPTMHPRRDVLVEQLPNLVAQPPGCCGTAAPGCVTGWPHGRRPHSRGRLCYRNACTTSKRCWRKFGGAAMVQGVRARNTGLARRCSSGSREAAGVGPQGHQRRRETNAIRRRQGPARRPGGAASPDAGRRRGRSLRPQKERTGRTGFQRPA